MQLYGRTRLFVISQPHNQFRSKQLKTTNTPLKFALEEKKKNYMFASGSTVSQKLIITLVLFAASLMYPRGVK